MEIEEKKIKLCLMGASLDTPNMGVSALAASLVKIIREACPDAKITFLIGSRSSKPQEVLLSGNPVKIPVVNYRLSMKCNIHEHLFWIFLMACLQRIMPIKSIRNVIIDANPFLNMLSKADWVGEIRGGDSFSDIYGLRRFILGSVPAIISLLLSKKLVLLPQTYGPYNSSIARFIARFIIRRSTYVLSRDLEGAKTIRKISGRQNFVKDIKFCPDVAFMLDSIKPNFIDIQPPIRKDLCVPLIGFNINGLMYNEGYTRNNMFGLKYDYKSFVHRILLQLLKETEAHVLLVPHAFAPHGNVNSDPDACWNVLKTLTDSNKKRAHLVNREYDQSEIKGIIGLCDFFIGSRMHSCIAALSQRIPTVGVAYSRKFVGVFDSVGAADMIADARHMNIDETIDFVLTSYHNRSKNRIGFEKKIVEAEQQIRKTFHQIFKTENET